MMDEATRTLQRCHCGEPVAAVSVPEMLPLGPAVRALCVYCLPVRCDAYPSACRGDS